MARCLFKECKIVASFSFGGAPQTARYCKKHAEGGMVDVRCKRCSHDSCMKIASFSIKGASVPLYCKQHAGPRMVYLRTKRCSHQSCIKPAICNVLGTQSPVVCEEHAEDGMVNVMCKRCSRASGLRRPCYNVGGKTSAHCNKHSEDGIVNIESEECAHDLSMRPTHPNSQGNPAGVRKQHATDGMAGVCNKLCFHYSCYVRRTYNVEAGDVPATCMDPARECFANAVGKRLTNESFMKNELSKAKGAFTAANCRQHPEVRWDKNRNRLCSHYSCEKHPSLNDKGSKYPRYCKLHAEDGMVNVVSKRCSFNTCMKHARFKKKNTKELAYCRDHPQPGTVDTRTTRCLPSCSRKQPQQGLSGNGTAVAFINGDKGDAVNLIGKRSSSSSAVDKTPKRPKSELEEVHRAQSNDRGYSRDTIAVQTPGLSPTKVDSQTAHAPTSARNVANDDGRLIAEQARPVILATSTAEEDSSELWIPVKSETNISVLL